MRPPPRGRESSSQALAYLVAALLFAGHLAFGANNTPLSLVFAAIWFALLALLMAQPWARAAMAGQPLQPLGVLFGLDMVIAALSLTAISLGGPHPVWGWAPGATPIGSLDPYATRLELLKLAALAAAFLVGCILGADDERFRRVARAILTIGVLYSAWAFVDRTINPTTLFGVPRISDPGRLAGSFESSNTAATLFGALTLLNIVDLARTYESRRPSGVLHPGNAQHLAAALVRPLVGLALSVACLLLTVSRAGVAASAAVALVLIGLMTLGRTSRGAISAPIVATLLVTVGLAVAFVASDADLLQRRFLAAGLDSVTREQIFSAHWAAFTAAPWGGYGLGAFRHVNGLVMGPANVAALDNLGAAHNVYIQWLEEAGLPGAVAMFATVGLIAVRLVIGALRRKRMRSWILAILACLTLFLLHGASDYAFQTPSMAVFLSLLLGLGASLSNRSTQSRPRAMRSTRFQQLIGSNLDDPQIEARPQEVQHVRHVHLVAARGMVRQAPVT